MTETILSIKNLSVKYKLREYIINALEDISLDLNKGSSLGVAGETGSGKSTLALAMMKLLPKYAEMKGKIIYRDKNLLELKEEELRKIRGSKISIVFQEPSATLNPVMSIKEHFLELFKTHIPEISEEEAIERASKLLEETGVPSTRLKDYPHMLSGGMKQRVSIALALALNPDLLIADEPTTALDVLIEAQILELFKKLKRERNFTFMLITHNLGVLAETVEEILILYAGKIAEYGKIDKVFNEPLHPYTILLLESVPSIQEIKKLSYIPGSPPDLANPPKGCRFHPRCPFAFDKCKIIEPELKKVNDRLVACHLYE
jgi:peptide/nickel transport system ATP-binding protein